MRGSHGTGIKVSVDGDTAQVRTGDVIIIGIPLSADRPADLFVLPMLSRLTLLVLGALGGHDDGQPVGKELEAEIRAFLYQRV